MIATLRLLAWLGAAALAGATVIGFAAPLGYPFELAVHFRPQIAAAGLIGAGAALAVRAPGAAAAALALAVLNIALILTAPAAPAPGEDFEPQVTAIWANLHRDPAAVDGLIALARTHDADVILVTETPQPMRDRIAAALPEHTCRVEAEGVVFGVAAYARPPCRGAGVSALDGEPDLAVRLEVSELMVEGVHAARPDSREHQSRRDRQLREVMLTQPRAALVVGDFNATPWSPIMAELNRGGLRRVRCGGPLASTWITRWPAFGLPIDHALVSGRAQARCAVGPDIGSDHLPLIVELGAAP